jgi:hypothetical protein
MAQPKPVLHYLQQLWQEAGLGLEHLIDESGNPRITLEEAISSIRDELASDIIPVGQANVLQARLNVFEKNVQYETLRGARPIADEDILQHSVFALGTKMQEAGRTAAAKIKDDVGIPAFFHWPTIEETTRPITSADFPAMGAEERRIFDRRWAEWENKVERALIKREGGAHVYDPFNVRLGDLSWQQREPLLREYEDIMGFRQLRERGLGPVFMKEIIDDQNRLVRSPVARYPVIVDPDDPRTLALARTNFQYRPGRLGTVTTAEMYLPSGRIARHELHEHTANVIREQGLLSKPGKTLVFDVESAGLDPEEGIWQLAAHMIDEKGEVIGDPRTFYFHNPTMQWKGEVGRNRQSIEQFLTKGEDVRDFPGGMQDFFKMVEEADYVGGHNIFFDYNMIVRGLKIKEDQLKDPEFTKGVNTFISKFYNEDTGQLSKVIDTHVLAQTQLVNIALAPELAAIGETKPYSLQNILLQTDLIERVRAAEGDEQVDAWLKRGLHYADVDVPFERHLMTALREQITGTGPGLRYAARHVNDAGKLVEEAGEWLTGADRERVFHSSAMTPLTFLTDFKEHVNDQLVEQMLRAELLDFDPQKLRAAGFEDTASVLKFVEQQGKKGVSAKEAMLSKGLEHTIRKIHLTPMEQMIAASRDFEQPIDEKIFMTPLPGYKDTFKNASGNIWKKLKTTFWDRPELPDRSLSEMVYQAGLWRDISKDFVTKKDRRITNHLGQVPTPEEWEAIQDRLAAAGIPFAHSSMAERHLMSVIGESMGPNLNNSTEGLVRSLYGGDVASMGRWSATRKITISDKGEQSILRIPHELLIEAGLLNADAETPQLLRLSPFQYETSTEKMHQEIGVMFEFSKNPNEGNAERKRLLEFLQNKYAGEIEPEAMALIQKTLGGYNTSQYGIQIGTFGGTGDILQNKAAASNIFTSLTQFTGVNVDSNAENTAKIYTAYSPLKGEEKGSKYLHTSGIVIKHEMLSTKQLKAMQYHIDQTRRLYTEAIDQAKNSTMVSYIASLVGRDRMADERGVKIIQGYFTAKKRAPLLALGAAVIGGIGWKVHHNRETRAYDQVMGAMPTEDEDWYDEYQNDIDTSHRPIDYRQAQTPNPLSTAGLMKTLDRRKTNHTNMSSDKYGYLFSRGYT